MIKSNKLIIGFIFAIAFLTACGGNTETKPSEPSVQDVSDEVEFSGDDLGLYCLLDDGRMIKALNLYMSEDEIDYENDETISVITGCDIGFGEVNGERYVNSVYFRGSLPPVSTAKSIYTTGVDYLDEALCSDELQVIEAYGLNPEEEELYFSPSEDSPSKILALYYNVGINGEVERVKYPKGTDISDFNSLTDCNACTYFEIRNEKVIGLSMKCRHTAVTK